MPTSLVTGGSGFLGSHLCETLLERGQRVICVDNLVVSTLENIDHLRDDAFTFVNHDVSQGLPIQGAVDRVFHLASLASPPDYLAHPVETTAQRSGNGIQMCRAILSWPSWVSVRSAACSA